jgi:hypothetical protein
VLDAFEGYEGLLDRTRHDEKIEEFKFWVELCGILGIEQIQIPATFDPADVASGDLDLIVADLREVADIGLSVSPPVKVRNLVALPCSPELISLFRRSHTNHSAGVHTSRPGRPLSTSSTASSVPTSVFASTPSTSSRSSLTAPKPSTV